MVASRSGGLIPEPVTRAAVPDPRRLETAAVVLRQRSELRLLVGLVERWGQVGTPTPAARLLQVEALLDLCQTERAAARLERAPPDEADDLGRKRVEARVLVDRGWLTKARTVLEEVRARAPDDAEVHELLRRVAHPLPPPPTLTDEAPFEARLAAAEALLRTGATLGGRRVLEALDRAHPGHPRVTDLLWAIQGEYDLPGSLDDVVRTFAPEPSDGGVELGAPAAALDADDTQITRLADVEATVDRLLDEADEDTAVLRVEGRWLEEETGVFRVPGLAREPTAPLAPPPPPPDDEDEGVVLLTRDTPLPPPRTARPLPVPEAVRPERRREPEPADLEEIEDLEEIDDVEEVEPDGHATLPPDDVPYGLLLASAAILAITGLAALGTLLWMAAQ